MANDARTPHRPERGFTLIEALIAVTIILIMAAVALPNIGQYVRNYKIRGAAQEVAGELQSARSRAIMSNTNLGVSFVIVDRETYRFVQEDMDATTPERRSPLKRLPSGVTFDPTELDGAGATLRFLRLGGFCNPAGTSTTCLGAIPVGDRSASGELVDSGTVDGKYIGALAGDSMEIRLREAAADIERTVRIAPGGRVLVQP